jgi:NAD(P)-dependent dehydrogenase (short-subunit alcohol dehydrogenase family)
MVEGKEARAALITGAAKRIGAEIARTLAAAGWFVHLHYRRSAAEAEALAHDLHAQGAGVRCIAADLEALDAAIADALVADCRREGPPLLAVVNNASLFELDTLESMSAQSWRRHLAVNLEAPVLLARAFARTLPPDANGCVVNLLDSKVVATNPDFFSYTISKQALEGATRTLALALAPAVRVCAVAPGITLISGKQSEEGFARAHRNNPLRRGCAPADIARAVRFLLDTPAITGQTIVIDGGHSLTRPPRDVAFL